MSYIPNRPVGDDPEMLYHQAVWDFIWGGRGRILSVPGKLDVSYTTKGILLDPKLRPGGKTSTPSESNFQGVYAPGSYDAMDWVVVQSGPVYGAYISTADGNTNAPWTGINWVNFSTLNQWF